MLLALLAPNARGQNVASPPRASHLSVAPQKADGIYQIGQPVSWRVEANGFGPKAEALYTIKRGGLTETGHGTLNLSDGKAEVTASLDVPGALLLEVNILSPDGKEHRALGGAVVAPDRISPSAERPEDFDVFWDSKISELEAVPVNAQLVPGDSGQPGIEYWRIRLDSIHGTHIRGQLARPVESDKLPALLIPQGAGVYPLDKSWVTGPATKGWLVLNILAHDLPIDEPAEFYVQQAAGPLKHYESFGSDDRNASYFLRMFLSCYQSAEYLTHRPDWDGRTLVVAGASQGGWQSLVVAGLHPKFTAALALVPAGCDMLGPDVGRQAGWPQWYSQIAGKDPARVRQASRYFDVVNFAPRIHCPVLVGLGLIDETCPPEGIMAALNQIDAPKEVIILPLSDHGGTNDSQREFYNLRDGAWLPALSAGQPAPVNEL